jgi:superfamily II DNA/RNA helicase
MLSDVA